MEKSKVKMTAQKVIELFTRHDGVLKSAEAFNAGVHPATLYKLRDQGKIEALGRGLYKIKNLKLQTDEDYLQVSKRFPAAITCLVSALYIHELTTQIPRSIHLAIPKGTHQPNVAAPACTFFIMSEETFSAGVEERKFQGVHLRIYDAEKTVVDCFKFRSRIGVDVAVEALKNWHERRQKKISKLLHYAKICRVEKIMGPYLEGVRRFNL